MMKDLMAMNITIVLGTQEVSYIYLPSLHGIVDIDVSDIRRMRFKDVSEIREKIEEQFAPHNIKMISKRAER